jgi:hypothetical protein
MSLGHFEGWRRRGGRRARGGRRRCLLCCGGSGGRRIFWRLGRVLLRLCPIFAVLISTFLHPSLPGTSRTYGEFVLK